MRQEFSYFAFDRQACTFINMCEAFVDTWDDHTSLERSLDLQSLTLKGARLCALADMDWAQQQCDITFSRRKCNMELLDEYARFTKSQFAPLLMSIFKDSSMLNDTDNRLWHELLPHPLQLFDVLTESIASDSDEGARIVDAFKSFVKGVEQVAGSSQTEVAVPCKNPIQWLWQMIELFTHLLYMIFHFQRAQALCEKEIPEEEAGINLQRCIHWYEKTAEGGEELKRFMEGLEFDRGRSLSVEELREERKSLRKIVPSVFQRCFMHNIGNMEEFGRAWLQIDATKEENMLLVEALAKWQLLSREIEELQHPERITPELYNNVFNTMLHDRRISMVELRGKIGRMLKFVDKKNKWICVWCVLNFHNMLKSKNLSAFTSQMMHEDWFGNSNRHQFNSNTLTEYSGYFTDTLFTLWNEDDYRRKKKDRWSDSLCTKFKDTCRKMDEAFRAEP